MMVSAVVFRGCRSQISHSYVGSLYFIKWCRSGRPLERFLLIILYKAFYFFSVYFCTCFPSFG